MGNEEARTICAALISNVDSARTGSSTSIEIKCDIEKKEITCSSEVDGFARIRMPNVNMGDSGQTSVRPSLYTWDGEHDPFVKSIALNDPGKAGLIRKMNMPRETFTQQPACTSQSEASFL